MRDLTRDEIANKMDFGNGYTCLCGECLSVDKDGEAHCKACGREYHLCVGIVGGWVTEKAE